MVERVLRVIRLDWTVFREIAQDPKALQEAAIIVVITTFLSAIGGGAGSGHFVTSFVANWLSGILVTWIGWAILTFLVGTILFKGKTDLFEMLRVLGYAVAPHLLGLLGIILCFRWIAPAVGAILALIAGIIAVREAMDFDTDKAIITVFISWCLSVGVQAVFRFVF